MAWYLIYSRPQQERVALLNLEQQGYVAYLPLHLQGGRQVPLFPRYLFIELNTETDNWSPIRSTRGVSKLIRFGGVPAKVPSDLVEYLRSDEASRLEKEKEVEFLPGDEVEVTQGVIAHYEGIFKEKVGSKRAEILLNISDHYTTIQVPLDQIKKR